MGRMRKNDYFIFLNHSASLPTHHSAISQQKQNPTYYFFPYYLLHRSKDLSSLGPLQTEIFHFTFISPVLEALAFDWPLSCIRTGPGEGSPLAGEQIETPQFGSHPRLATFRRREMCACEPFQGATPRVRAWLGQARLGLRTKIHTKGPTSPGVGVVVSPRSRQAHLVQRLYHLHQYPLLRRRRHS